LVEEIDGTRLVHADVSIEGELLILLHSRYPERVKLTDILNSMQARNAGSVRNNLRKLRMAKLLHGDTKIGYRLTQAGHAATVDEIKKIGAV
jgi:hypothetical protein